MKKENLKKYEDAFFNSLLEGNRLECRRVSALQMTNTFKEQTSIWRRYD